MAYQILRNKNIDIQASDEVIDYFEQNELKLYDYFENIYHKNGKKIDKKLDVYLCKFLC